MSDEQDPATDGLAPGTDGDLRCWWGVSTPDYTAYHDDEWGWPVTDDAHLFEKLCLEGFQSGLSWLTILRKRDDFRRVFHGFDPEQVARMDEADVARLLTDASIVRHRGKIEASIGNARALLDLRDEVDSFAGYVWSFEPDASDRPPVIDGPTVMAMPTSAASTALSKDLKKRGFRFVGPTTAYAFLQSMGVVNDHIEGCISRVPAERAREALVRPTR